MKKFAIRLYKRVKSEMPLFFKRLGALSTALTGAAIAGLEHKDKLPEWCGHYLSNVLSIGIAVTVFCFFTKVKDLPGADNDDEKEGENA